MTHPRWIRTRRLVRWIVLNTGVTLALLLVLEGAASARAAHHRASQRQNDPAAPIVAERHHTEYDPLLGWINRPGIAIDDFYGEGRDLRTNARRFRAHDALDPLSTSSATRLVVSGDSFTFGYGVDDEDSWVAQLDRAAPQLEVVNMGQGGYGLCQAYLWYTRDGQHLPHQLHVTAFITENYHRLGRDRFMGYGKPVVTSRGGRLSVENVPTPRPLRLGQPWRGWMETMGQLHLAQAVRSRAASWSERQRAHRKAHVQEASRLIFEDLYRLHRAAGREGALVHLPIQKDYRDGASNGWRHWLRLEAEKQGWTFVDLVAEMRKLPAAEIPGLFIQEHDERFRGAKGHYTEKGNAFVADALRRQLGRHPAWTPHLTSPDLALGALKP